MWQLQLSAVLTPIIKVIMVLLKVAAGVALASFFLVSVMPYTSTDNGITQKTVASSKKTPTVTKPAPKKTPVVVTQTPVKPACDIQDWSWYEEAGHIWLDGTVTCGRALYLSAYDGKKFIGNMTGGIRSGSHIFTGYVKGHVASGKLAIKFTIK